MPKLDDEEILRRARNILYMRMLKSDVLTSSHMMKEYLTHELAGLEHEVFVVVFLSNQHQVICHEHMFRGTIDGAAVYPREVVKQALRHNASAVVFAHNHPSGVSEPSQADVSITQRLKVALNTLDIRVLDHIVVGCGECTSFAERGLI